MPTFLNAIRNLITTAITGPAYSQQMHPVRAQETRKLEQHRSFLNL